MLIKIISILIVITDYSKVINYLRYKLLFKLFPLVLIGSKKGYKMECVLAENSSMQHEHLTLS